VPGLDNFPYCRENLFVVSVTPAAQKNIFGCKGKIAPLVLSIAG
jgi:hypothetical protein